MTKTSEQDGGYAPLPARRLFLFYHRKAYGFPVIKPREDNFGCSLLHFRFERKREVFLWTQETLDL